MGNNEASSQAERFQMRDWELTDQTQTTKVWRNCRDRSQRIQEHCVYTSNEEQHMHEQQIYNFRKYHPCIVAAYYFESTSESEFCSSAQHHKVFIEKIPITLSDIEHIPFPDVLHVYWQALRGFQQISSLSNIGFFAVEEEYLGINDKGVVKVWMNQNYSANYFVGSKVSEESMVNSIVEIIEKNTDHRRIPSHIPSIRNYLYRNTDKLKFAQANREFQRYLSEYQLNVPANLQCIHQVGGIQAIENRERNKHTSYREMETDNSYRNRPQLIDSQLRNQFPMLTPRVSTYQSQVAREEKAIFLNNSQVVPSTQNHAVTPAALRQNTPIVRKSTPVYYHPTNQFFMGPPTLQTIGYSSNQSSKVELRPVFLKQANNSPVLTHRIAGNQNSHIASKSSSLQRPNIESKQGAKQSFIDLVQAQKGLPLQGEKIFRSNLNSSKTISSYEDVSRKQIPALNSYQMSQPFNLYNNNSIPRSPQRRPNSSYLQFKQTVSHSVKKCFDDESIWRNKPKNLQIDSIQQRVYESSQKQGVQMLPQAGLKDATQKNGFLRQNSKSINIKQSQYTTIDIDDGKSSIDFLRKLKQFNNFSSKQGEGRAQLPNNQNSLGNMDGLNSNFLTKQANSVQNLHSAEDFGRNAVSNIIPTQSAITNQPNTFDHTPLKFQNNLEMKYSMFKDDSPEANYNFGYIGKSYQANFDADIFADLNNMKRNL